MDHRDISPEIAEIAKNYSSPALPSWVLRAQEILQQLQQRLQEFLESLFYVRKFGSSSSSSMSTLIQYALYIAGLIALIAILYLLFKRVKERKQDFAATTRGAAAVEKILDSAGYRAEALRLAEKSEFKGASRAAYLCFLQQMHEKGVAAFAPAKTNYEYRYLLSAYPHLKDEFMKLASIVEEVWFGNKQAEFNDYENCLAIVDQARFELEKIEKEKAMDVERREA
ncbi:MAG: DUF4129 domain-containing protein [Candidatus Obscuribacterales bacterium]|nr:DUF4129 domain-containing protein [Candidatus Obscuribacterales bacterium]